MLQLHEMAGSAPCAMHSHSLRAGKPLTGGVRGMILQNCSGCSMQVCVNIDVAPSQVALDQHLILLHVPPTYHQVIFAGDEPAKERWH